MIGGDTNLLFARAVGQTLESFGEFKKTQVMEELPEHVGVAVLRDHDCIGGVTAVEKGRQVHCIHVSEGHLGKHNDCFLHVPTLDPDETAT